MARLRLPALLYPDASELVEDMTSPDVLVLGGGMAGLCAAIEAREAGARVLLVEESPAWRRGGNARHARNMREPHEEPTPFSPRTYPRAELVEDLYRISAGLGDPDLIETVARHAHGLSDWLIARGVALQFPEEGVLPHSRKTVFFLGGGTAMIRALYREAERLGVRILFEAEARTVDLNGRTEVLHAGRVLNIRPGATVVCSGGYQANRKWLQESWGRAAHHLVLRGTKYAMGGPLRDLLDQGVASSGEPGFGHLVAVDARSPKWDGGIVTRVEGVQYGIAVTASGRRFFDEGKDVASTRYGTWGRMALETSGQLAWAIMDARAAAHFPSPVYPPIEAPTLEELAPVIHMDPQVLAGEVREYNSILGAEPDGRRRRLEPPRTRPAPYVVKPPFRAVPFRPGITFTCYGLKVDSRARVMRLDGYPCETVFAAGMIMAPGVLGRGYVSGAALMVAAVFGRIAGRNAARLRGHGLLLPGTRS
ncbi:FAD-dependent tricarballylate dehydrogenase TcuA [Phaeovibrio sulfidiphilus]|uniref:FAD-dependent tricarballylate dehydrogenase TcuA n=1 Tax=Phaeovibrio sulfidiphilus TaxID=1220600 RepID=A0A8J7CBM9_9PROT|nr:FAD-dependent tricarballylate dehydrogenase TcuA [Phaeovibrio sulfidiphilus]MBE1236348.1 FAD-dependent tricarballylate dehydrogenase TcuA [Phaeovibrio sulfidiphilus]